MTDQLDLDGLAKRLRSRVDQYNDREGSYAYIGDDCSLDDRAADALDQAATRLRASEAATAAAVEALETGDLWWDPNDPEEGHNSMEDAFGHATQWDYDGPVELSRARSLPNVWTLKINIDTTGDGEADDYEIRLFATLAEAEAVQAEIDAALPTPSSGGE